MRWTSSVESEIDTLYPYSHKVIQVKVRPAWMLRAEQHGRAIMRRKKTAQISSWDVSQRLGEIAFGVKYDILETYPEEGKRCPPFILCGLTVSVHTSPFDERYKSGNEMSLRVLKKYSRNAQIHVLGAYDPPFVDLLGWTTLPELLEAADYDGRTSIPASHLRPMVALLEFVKP